MFLLLNVHVLIWATVVQVFHSEKNAAKDLFNTIPLGTVQTKISMFFFFLNRSLCSYFSKIAGWKCLIPSEFLGWCSSAQCAHTQTCTHTLTQTHTRYTRAHTHTHTHKKKKIFNWTFLPYAGQAFFLKLWILRRISILCNPVISLILLDFRVRVSISGYVLSPSVLSD